MNHQIRLVIQLSLGTLFAISVAGKLANPKDFIRGVKEYQILPPRSAFVFALLVIGCEVALSLSHLGGWLLIFAVPVGLTLLCVFFVAVSISLARQRDLPCFCFGNGEGEMISARSLTRLGIAILGEAALLFQPGFFSGSSSRPAFYASSQDVVLLLSWVLIVLLATVWGLTLPDLLNLALGKFHNQRSNSSHS